MSMRDLLERTEYLLNGGVLSLLSESLAAHSERGMILRPEGEDMEVLEAFGASVESLFMKGRAGEIKGAFPSSSVRGDYDVSAARLDGEWPWGLRIRGWDWAFYVLLSDEPSASLMEDMPSFAGLIALWQRHQRIVGVEERLSRLAYMVLATKSTLASVFEPMGLSYFGAFLRDVVMESLFPSRLSILLDRGGELSLLAGEDLPLPPRSGIFARDILSPALARIDGASPESVGAEVFRSLSGGWSAILPIIGGDARLFCLLKWEKQLGEEALNFIELLGNVASKALSMAAMREEKDRNLRALSRRAFLLNALYEAGLRLLEQTSRETLLLQVLDIFSEMSHAARTVLVAWRPDAGGYVLLAAKEDGVVTRTGRPLGPQAGASADRRPESLTADGSRLLFEEMNVPFLSSPEVMNGVDRVFPLWEGDGLAGFVAVSAPRPGTNLMDVETLEILARSASAALPGREWESSRPGNPE